MKSTAVLTKTLHKVMHHHSQQMTAHKTEQGTSAVRAENATAGAGT
jgi:hypothetical protein